jgi:lipopolysaccharide cholinephosphotransferase
MYKIWRTSTDDQKAIKKVRRIFDFNNKILFPFLRGLLGILIPLSSFLLPRKTITSGMGIPFHNPRYAKEIFPLTTHEFEGLQLSVPGNYHRMLTTQFGDYMQLPDLDHLTGHVQRLEFFDE